MKRFPLSLSSTSEVSATDLRETELKENEPRKEHGGALIEYTIAIGLIFTVSISVLPFFLDAIKQRDTSLSQGVQYQYPVSLSCQTAPGTGDTCP